MKNEFLRHMLATIKYRFEKSILDAGPQYADFTLGKGSRTPKELLNHIYIVLLFGRSFIEKATINFKAIDNLDYAEEVARFLKELKKMNQILQEKELEIDIAKRLLQGPFSDILTHIGQLAMLQRLNDHPVQKENFYKASIDEKGI